MVTVLILVLWIYIPIAVLFIARLKVNEFRDQNNKVVPTCSLESFDESHYSHRPTRSLKGTYGSHYIHFYRSSSLRVTKAKSIKMIKEPDCEFDSDGGSSMLLEPLNV